MGGGSHVALPSCLFMASTHQACPVAFHFPTDLSGDGQQLERIVGI